MSLSPYGRIRVNVTGARGALGIDIDGTINEGQVLVKTAGGSRKFAGGASLPSGSVINSVDGTAPDKAPAQQAVANALNGKASATFSRSDTASVPVDLLTKLRAAPRAPIDFGLLGNWAQGNINDDTAGLQALLDAAYKDRRGVMPLQDGIFYINQQLVIPQDCGFDGGVSAGEPSGRAFGLRRATFVCGPNGSVRADRGSVLRNVNEVKIDCASIPANQSDALGKISSFNGTGITINGPDVLLERVTLVGFASGVVSAGNERPTIISPRLDCTNGIDISNCTDTGRIHDPQIWPFWSAHNAGFDPSVLLRSGTALSLHDTADGFLVSQPLTYGYTAGIALANVYGVKVSDFWIDGVLASQGTQMASGIKTGGQVVNCGFSNGHVDSQSTNYNFGHNASPGVMVGNCTGGGFSGQQVFLGTGSGGCINGFQSIGGQSGSIGEITTGAGVSDWGIDDWLTQNSAAAKFIAYGSPADQSRIRFGMVRIINGPSSDFAFAQFLPNGVPLNNPVGGGYLYVDGGALKYRGPNGTITTVGAA